MEEEKNMDYSDFAIDLMKEMVSIPSESQNEKEIAFYLYEVLRGLGLATELQQLKRNSYNVLAKKKGTGTSRRKLLLGGHIDTVKADKAWKSNPFQVKERGGRFYGLGCGDMKAGLAAQIAVLKKLIDEGTSLDGEIELVCLCDEERYSIGANAYVDTVRKRGEPPADFAIFAEPHYDNIVIGASGKILLKIEITGSTCHGAMPERGINAVSCMAKLIQALDKKYEALYRQGETASHCVLEIDSPWKGYSLNVPDRCTCLLNKQLNTAEKAEDFITDLRSLYDQNVGEGSIHISRGIPCYPSYVLEQNNDDLKNLCRLTSEIGGFDPVLHINQSVSDGNILFCELGIPVVLFGPQGVNFHRAGEYVIAETVRQYINILDQYIRHFFKG